MNAKLTRHYGEDWIRLRVWAADVRDGSAGERRLQAETLVTLLDTCDRVRDTVVAPALWQSCRLLEAQLRVAVVRIVGG